MKRARNIVVGLILAGVMGVAAAPAAAAPAITGPPSMIPPMPPGAFVRGVPMVPTVRIPATEGAVFGFLSPQGDLSAAGPCTTSIGVLCLGFFVPAAPPAIPGNTEAVVVLTDGDATPDEPLLVTITPTYQPQQIGLSSAEGSPSFLGLAPSLLVASANALAGTQGGTQQTLGLMPVVPNPGTDATIALTTTGPAPGTMVTQGTNATYSATLTRGGVLTQTTAVAVSLNPVSGLGTTPVGPVTVTFLPGETIKNVSLDASVPFSTTPGTMPSYSIKASYDPTEGPAAFPIDTENGTPRSFEIAAGTPPTPPPPSGGGTTTPSATTPPSTTTTPPATKKKCKKGKKRNRRGKCVKKKKKKKK